MNNQQTQEPDGLLSMIASQREFMLVLMDKGKLPTVFEINQDLTSKSSQTFIRELCQFFLEELSEAYEMYSYIHNALPDLQRDLEKFYQALGNFNEELADCTAFILEIWIYLGITSSDIKTTLQSEGESRTGEFTYPDDILNFLMSICKDRNRAWGFYTLNSALDTFPLFGEDTTNYLYQAGRRLHVSNKSMAQTLNWQVTYQAFQALSLLKSKPWRSSEVELDTTALKKEFINVGLNFFQIADFYGATSTSILKNYLRKTDENFKRQEEGY